MYKSFYNLAEMPFTIGTDPRFLWLGDKHSEALANLNYGLVEADGYVVLTGDVGVGKTTLVNALLESIDDSILAVNLSHPNLSIMEFFRFFAKTLDGPNDLTSKVDYLFFFEDALLKMHNEGRKVLLIIDEAHTLSEELLEEIRLLSNIEHQGTRLITIFFVGQNEFKDILINPQFRALRQRITLFYDIKPLTAKETASYIKHRLQVAGGDGDVFSAEAVAAVHAFSKGYPRLINTICGRSMLTGYIQEKKKIDAAIVRECSKELDFLDPTQVAKPVVTTQSTDVSEPAQSVSVPERPVSPHVSKQKAGRQESESPPVRAKAKAEEPIQISPQDTPEFADVGKRRFKLPEHTGNIIAVLIIIGIFGFYLFPEKNGSNAGFEPKKEMAEETSARQDISSSQDEEVGEITTSSGVSSPQEKKSEANSASVDRPSQDQKNKGTVKTQETEPVKIDEGEGEIAVESPQKESPGIVEENIETEEPALENEQSVAATQPQEKPEVQTEPAPPTALELAAAALDDNQYQTVLDLLNAEGAVSAEQREVRSVLYNSALVGKAEQLMGRFPKEAKRLLRQVVAVDDTNSRAFFLLGKLHTQDKEYAQAIDAYQKSARFNPTFPDSFFNLGFLYATTGMYENSERFFQQAVDMEPDYLGKALFNLAIIQARLGKNEESLANLRRASELDPDNEKVKEYLQRAEAN